MVSFASMDVILDSTDYILDLLVMFFYTLEVLIWCFYY